MNIRPRRLRQNSIIREMISETILTPSHLIQPLFLTEGKNQKMAIQSMPGQFRFSIDEAIKVIDEMKKDGVKTFALFPVVDEKLKTSTCIEALNKNNLNFRASRTIKEAHPDIILMGDIALDPYSSDGHDGLVENGKILNDETLEILSEMSLLSAQNGYDILGPSDMMDGRVKIIRETLEKNKLADTLIMSYTAKYASSFYGPFRDALESHPKAGDKKTYQMDFRNSLEAIKEMELDIAEGADMVMVKPGLSYLDIIHVLKKHSKVPVAAYNVSGEYAMVKAAHEKGWINGEKVMMEMLYSFRRAGADIILTYFAREASKLL
jgi:porphobilinogen synthase